MWPFGDVHRTKSDITPEEDGVKEVVKEVNQFFADFVDTGAAVQQGKKPRGSEWFWSRDRFLDQPQRFCWEFDALPSGELT